MAGSARLAKMTVDNSLKGRRTGAEKQSIAGREDWFVDISRIEGGRRIGTGNYPEVKRWPRTSSSQRVTHLRQWNISG